MSNNSKSILSSIIFFILVYVIYQYYIVATAPNIVASEVPGIVTEGIILILAIGVASSMKYYYGKSKENQTSKGMQLDAEIKAYSMLADEKPKNISIKLTVSDFELQSLKNGNNIHVGLSRFKIPVRTGDRINLHIDDSINGPCIDCLVKNINTFDKIVELQC